MSVDCGLAQTLLKKFGDLEKRVTYQEEESRGHQDLIVEFRTKVKKLKQTTKNKSKLSQEKPAANPKPELIGEIESTQNGPFKILKKDPKINLKLVIRMGVRCDEETQRILNPVGKRIENGHSIKIFQTKSECTQNDAKSVEISSKSKPKSSVKKSFVCSFCTKSFQDFSRLSDHMRIHTGERPFKCKICSKSFKVMGYLKTHSRSHTGEKPFSCTVCSKTFSHNSNLKNHMRIHTGEKHFSCSVCSKSFFQPTNVKRHMMVHTGEKPYPCSFCLKYFSQIVNRNTHIRAHLGEKPYTCSVCSKTFAQYSGLFKHRKIHTGEKPHSCSICAKNFSTNTNMKRHERTHGRKLSY